MWRVLNSGLQNLVRFFCGLLLVFGSSLCEPAPLHIEYAAKVNGTLIPSDEIMLGIVDTVRSLNNTAQAQSTINSMINQVISQVLIIQDAEKDGLSSKEDVKARVELAKRAAEADIYLNSRKYPDIRVTLQDIDEFAQKHPEYFSGRKYYHYILITADKNDKTSEVISSAYKLDGIASVMSQMKEQGLSFSVFDGWQATEQIPSFSSREQLLKLKENQSAIYNSPDGKNIFVIRLIKEEPAPISFEDAKSNLAQTMAMHNLEDAQQSYINSLRSKANIEINPAILDESFKVKINSPGDKHSSSLLKATVYALCFFLAAATIIQIIANYETYISPFKENVRLLIIGGLMLVVMPWFAAPLWSIYIIDKTTFLGTKPLFQGIMTGLLSATIIIILFHRIKFKHTQVKKPSLLLALLFTIQLCIQFIL